MHIIYDISIASTTTQGKIPMRTPPHIAWFISPHGFGHAARASAVMEGLLRLRKDLHFDLFTTIPKWFFNKTLSRKISCHHLKTDVGMVQTDPLREDLSRTMTELEHFLPFDEGQLAKTARTLKNLQCRLVISDIAPMGIAAAKTAGIKSVLIENFTWDWIYTPYVVRAPRMKHHIDYLKSWFRAADLHIQTDPVCNPVKCDLLAPPASRHKTRIPGKTRKALGLAPDDVMILISMGGVPATYTWLDRLKEHDAYVFVIPGAADSFSKKDNLILMPPKNRFFHPDLVHAADAVVGKVGYSTLAEIYQAGTRFGFISRPDFPEAKILSKYVREQMVGKQFTEDEFASGSWTEKIPELFSLQKQKKSRPNGADIMAAFLLDHL